MVEYTGKPRLFNGGPEDIRQFVVAVTGLAVEDHQKKRHAPRTGKELVDSLSSTARVFHRRMATGLYNHTRHTLECMDKEKED